MIGLRTLKSGKPGVYYGVTLLLLAGIFAGIIGYEYRDEQELAAIPGQLPGRPAGKVSLVVKVPARTLELHSDGKLHKKYRIAVGRSDTPSPIGEWIVSWKSYRSGDIFGTRFLGLNVPWGGYGIHGTNRPWSIGQFASKGCIRLRNKDIEELFEWVPVGTPVRIEGSQGRIARTLKYTAVGPDVVLLQIQLRKLGYFEGRADGVFSRDVETAVKRLQHDKGLQPSGGADRRTLDLLGL